MCLKFTQKTINISSNTKKIKDKNLFNFFKKILRQIQYKSKNSDNLQYYRNTGFIVELIRIFQ